MSITGAARKQAGLYYDKGGGAFNVQHPDFGASPSASAAVNTTAFAAWATAITAAGGGVGIIPPGSYAVNLTKTTHVSSPFASPALCQFANLNGFRLHCEGATITDANTYSGDESVFASFTACSGLHLGRLKTTSAPQGGGVEGFIAYVFLQGCKGVRAEIETVGGQKAIFINREFADPLSYVSSGFNLQIVATNTLYPLLTKFSGSDLDANIVAVGCGRNYFPVGSANQRVSVHSKNQTGATVIDTSSGVGCSDIFLKYVDTESDVGHTSSEAILLQWVDQTPATHRNINIDMDILNPAATPFFYSFAINKVDNSGNPDVVGRGHILDGLTIKGRSQQINNVDHLRVFGAFASGSDQVSNVSLRDLTMISTGTSNSHLGNLLRAQLDQSHFDHVYTDGGLYASEAFTVSAASNATPIQITTDAGNDIFDKMSVTIAGVLGNLAANGTFFCDRIDNTHFNLYSDAGLTTPVAGTGAYTSGGSGLVVGTSLKKTVYVNCTAKEVTAGLTDSGLADYISCAITTGAKQSNASKKYDGRTVLNTVPQPQSLPRMTAAQLTAFPLTVQGWLGFDTDNSRAVTRNNTWEPIATFGTSVVTYSASMTGQALYAWLTVFTVAATNGTAFTINAPQTPVAGKQVTWKIKNASGGALGAATWDVIYKMGTWTQPANGFSRSITFWYDGTNWVEISRTPVDVAN